MPNINNVTYGKPKAGGAVYSAPAGTALPVDAASTLAVAYKELGYISEDGLTNENTPETELIKAWGGDVVLTPQTGKTDTFTYTLIEPLNIDVLKEVYGSANVTGSIATSEGIKITANSAELSPHVIVVKMILKKGILKTIVIPNGIVSEVGEIVYSDGDAVGYETTITALPDASGNSHYEYILDPTAPAGTTFTATQAGGTTGSADSTSITLVFSGAVTGLTANHITLIPGTGFAVKGALTGSGANWSLAISNPAQGTIGVMIAGVAGFAFPTAPVTATVFSN